MQGPDFSRTRTQADQWQNVTAETDPLRLARHQRLIQNIRKYKMTPDEYEKLEWLRKRTLLEIDVRYAQSEQNRQYVFPRVGDWAEDEGAKDRELKGSRRVFYDLRSQNETRQEGLSLRMGKRVKSLDEFTVKIDGIKKSARLGMEPKVMEKLRKNNSEHRLKKPDVCIKPALNINRIMLPVLSHRSKMLKTEAADGPGELYKIVMEKIPTEMGSNANVDRQLLQTRHLHKSHRK